MPNGSWLYHDASYEGAMFNNLTLQWPLPPGKTKPYKQAARWPIRPSKPESPIRWRDTKNRRFTSLTVCGEKRLLAAGHPDAAPQRCFLAAIDIATGKDAWFKKLPALPVKGGCHRCAGTNLRCVGGRTAALFRRVTAVSVSP